MPNNLQFSKGGVLALQEIKRLLDAAEAEFKKLSDVENMLCFEFHNEGASLNHCLRWGPQAVDDLLVEIGNPTLGTAESSTDSRQPETADCAQ